MFLRLYVLHISMWRLAGSSVSADVVHVGLCIPTVLVLLPEPLPPALFVVSAVEVEAEMSVVLQVAVESELPVVSSSLSLVVPAVSWPPVAFSVLVPLCPPDRWLSWVEDLICQIVGLLRSGVPEVLCTVLGG